MNFESASSDEVLEYGLGVLKQIYKKAKKRDDTALMLNIADRLLLLYESMSDIEKTKRPVQMGFIKIGEDEE